jgi:hypothetical protein
MVSGTGSRIGTPENGFQVKNALKTAFLLP